MAIIKLFNRNYEISSTEEQKLLELSNRLNQRVKENLELYQGANEMLIMLLTALTLEDLVQDLEKQNSTLQQQIKYNLQSEEHGLEQDLETQLQKLERLKQLISQ
jgi:cell division protein ZapA (FtsZ GTPase activity inhibitor)